MSAINDSDHDRGLIQIIAPGVRNSVRHQPITGPKAHFSVFHYEYRLSGDHSAPELEKTTRAGARPKH